MKRLQDSPVDLVESLKALGLTKYEALVYIALLRVTCATASEIHESSGVPRASVYPVIDQLLDKELVSVSQSAPKRFAAIPPENAVEILTARIGRDTGRALDGLKSIYRQKTVPDQNGGELIWNLYGITAIQKRLQELVAGAESDIRIVAQPPFLSAEIIAALEKIAGTVKIEIITAEWDGPVPPAINLFIRRPPGLPADPDRIRDMMTGGICIIDSRKVMVIIGSGEEDAVALFSESEGFVRFFVRYYGMFLDWAKK